MKIRISKNSAKEKLLKTTEETVTTKKKKAVASDKASAKKNIKSGEKKGKLKATGTKAKGGKTKGSSAGSAEKQKELQAILGECRPSIEKAKCRIVEPDNGTVVRVFTDKSKGYSSYD